MWEERGAFILRPRGLREFSMTMDTCSPDELVSGIDDSARVHDYSNFWIGRLLSEVHYATWVAA
jgi:hypothetical protein